MIEIFDFMKDIFFEEYESFKETVDEKRKVMSLADKSLLADEDIYLDINKAKNIPNGRLNIVYEKILFECVFHYKAGEKLYVILNGALKTLRQLGMY